TNLRFGVTEARMIDPGNAAFTDFLETFNRLAGNTKQLGQLFDQILGAERPCIDKALLETTRNAVQAVLWDVQIVQEDIHRVSTTLQQLHQLMRTSTLITSSLDVGQVLEDVMDTVIHMIGAERAYLIVCEEDTLEPVIHAARNWDRATLSIEDIEFSRGIVESVRKEGQAILTTNAQLDDRFRALKSVSEYGLRSIL